MPNSLIYHFVFSSSLCQRSKTNGLKNSTVKDMGTQNCAIGLSVKKTTPYFANTGFVMTAIIMTRITNPMRLAKKYRQGRNFSTVATDRSKKIAVTPMKARKITPMRSMRQKLARNITKPTISDLMDISPKFFNNSFIIFIFWLHNNFFKKQILFFIFSFVNKKMWAKALPTLQKISTALNFSLRDKEA